MQEGATPISWNWLSWKEREEILEVGSESKVPVWGCLERLKVAGLGKGVPASKSHILSFLKGGLILKGLPNKSSTWLPSVYPQNYYFLKFLQIFL